MLCNVAWTAEHGAKDLRPFCQSSSLNGKMLHKKGEINSMNGEQFHLSGDEALGRLSKHQGAEGELARAFLNRGDTEDRTWLETWFRTRIDKHFAEPLSGPSTIPSFEHVPSQNGTAPSAPPIKLKSVQAHYFRGFREGLGRVDMDKDFIVIEGRNSSGKTSFAEALEWLFSGSLSRREGRNSGHARELEHCIANVFRADKAETWVSATFVKILDGGNTEEFNLRRVLQEDYGITAKATCSSVLFFDERELSPAEEKQVLERYFVGVPPLLMQHNLRDFVLGDPKVRRMYFERLLHLDELTELIRLAVMTDQRATEFPSPSGGHYLRLWDQLGSYVNNDLSRKAHRKLSKKDYGDTSEKISDALSSISRVELPTLLDGLGNNEEIAASLRTEQMRVRQDSFPILAQLRPRRQLADNTQEPRPGPSVEALVRKLRDVWEQYEPTLVAVQAIGDNDLAVSKAFKLLLDSGVIQHGKDSQICPLCAYEYGETLSATRISVIESWSPIRDSEQAARQILKKAMDSLVYAVRQPLEECDQLLPSPPKEFEWDRALQRAGDRLKEEFEQLRSILKEQSDLSLHVSLGKEFVSTDPQLPTSIEQCESFIRHCVRIVNGLQEVPTRARVYREALTAVEAAVGVEASRDPKYLFRKCLIECFENVQSISNDFRWEQAKWLAQKDLERVRDSLIAYRKQFLEVRRTSFNNGIASVWNTLRKEGYSSFSQLHIPPPKGRGFPIEIELKALLDDSSKKKEVDVLRVFSESQLNALGIAAFVTRAKMLGHRLLIFDDPVQSMDEEHFKTFARDLIPSILKDGFQVVLLTHNDTFARDVSHYHYDRTDYVTMSIRLSRREGSVLEEGNRRVHERLKLAESKLEDGLFDDAWKYIRLAIERLYLITYVKYGPPNSDAAKWQHQTAEYMWNSGTGEVIQSKLPNSEKRLKEILDMTAGGAHDVLARGETDIRDSLKFLRKVMNKLRLGG